MAPPGWASVSRRALGLLLMLLVLAPFYRLLDSPETGLAGAATVGLSRTNSSILWWGLLLIALPAFLLGRFLPARSMDAALERAGRTLRSWGSLQFAATLGFLAGALTLAFTLGVLQGQPNLIDAFSQLLHARYLAAGRLAGPASAAGEFWHIYNTVPTPGGWVSQYPPGHVLLLAAGFRLGAVWAVGPALMALLAFCTARLAERLLPRDPAAARLGALAVTLSPFLIGLAGAYMNHVTAAACAALALYAALRARQGAWAWALLAGAALGFMFATRPLSAVAAGAAVALGLTPGAAFASPTLSTRRSAGRYLAAALGFLPFCLALAAYNAHFFGAALRFGYEAALGPDTRLGFGVDPWGNRYGLAEAVGYTSAELLALGLALLETPVSLVALAGTFLLVARRLEPGERLLLAWALLPVLANVFYWHHGLFMGPRMLYEAAPAWALLAALGSFRLVQMVPPELRRAGRFSPRVALNSAWLLSALAAVVYFAPRSALAHRPAEGDAAVPSVLAAAASIEGPALVFVHDGWASRTAMRLAARGMRLDSVEAALRQNPTCRVHRFARAYPKAHAGPGTPPDSPRLDLLPRATGLPPRIEIAPGSAFRLQPGAPLDADCRREAHADRYGGLDLAPLLWQGDLAGLPARGPMFVRDLGPAENRELIRRFPERRPLLLLPGLTPGAPPALRPYNEAMQALWGMPDSQPRSNARESR